MEGPVVLTAERLRVPKWRVGTPVQDDEVAYLYPDHTITSDEFILAGKYVSFTRETHHPGRWTTYRLIDGRDGTAKQFGTITARITGVVLQAPVHLDQQMTNALASAMLEASYTVAHYNKLKTDEALAAARAAPRVRTRS